MSQNPKIQAEVIDVEPCAVYKGNVYDKEIVIELEGLGRVNCFDPHASAKDNHIGQNVKVALELLAFRPAKPTDKNPGLYKRENGSDWNYRAVGDVTAVVDAEDSENNDIILNISDLEVVVTGLDFDKKLEGDRIELENNRIDVKSIENS